MGADYGIWSPEQPEVRERGGSVGGVMHMSMSVIGSSQSRVAKMEAGDASVSVDLLLRSLLALGVKRVELAAAIAGKRRG